MDARPRPATRLRPHSRAPTPRSDLLARKLDEGPARQRDLALLESELQQLLHASGHIDPAECTAGQVCHIIARQRPARSEDVALDAASARGPRPRVHEVVVCPIAHR